MEVYADAAAPSVASTNSAAAAHPQFASIDRPVMPNEIELNDLPPAFSRSGVTSPFGKLDDWLERTRIEGVIKDRFQLRTTAAFTQAGFAGRPAAEVVRDMVRVVALGPDEAARMYGAGVLTVVQMIRGMSDK